MDRKELYEAFRKLDRSFFLDDSCKGLASYDGPLPIGYGQTISQPSLVVEMTALLDPEPTSRVLEIGTGSGYQTALLAPFCKAVYTIERIPELAAKAKERLEALGFKNIYFRVGDGSNGWPEEAPFDRIIVTAAAAAIPPALIEQLSPGGRLVIPVGPRGLQDLVLVRKTETGKIIQETIEKVAFVELVGPYGWSQQDRQK
ncbi:MAG: protein-L-isoaspartate(D-aspartate) O-methyltransferase [Clostridia bacterium]|nr:protein-L-isoaspartate(D-aspartate) O-methyltransferase [Clostridia bacterium]